MRAFLRTIAVFIVLSSAAESIVLARNAGPKEGWETAKKEMMDAREEVEAAQREMQKELRELESEKEALRHYEMALPEPPAPTVELLRSIGMSRGSRDDAAGSVLVIPADQIKAQDLAAIMEDMSVMSRIFDKKLEQTHVPGRGGFGGGGFGGGSYGGGFGGGFGMGFSSQSVRPTEVIYLQGYGALFLMKVNFPLLPPVEVEEKETKEAGDPVWEEAKRRMYEPDDERRARRGRSSRSERREEYDAEKIEDLKRKLLQTLKHAANIRNLKSDEWIILTVIGDAGWDSNVISSAVRDSARVVIEGDRGSLKLYASTDGAFSSPTVLTIRVKKADVDAFAKDKLDFEKFQERAGIFIY